MIEPGIIGRSPYNKSVKAEHITENIRMIRLADIVHHNILDPILTGRTGNNLSHSLCIAIHSAIADNDTLIRIVPGKSVIKGYDSSNLLMPDRAMGRTD